MLFILEACPHICKSPSARRLIPGNDHQVWDRFWIQDTDLSCTLILSPLIPFFFIYVVLLPRCSFWGGSYTFCVSLQPLFFSSWLFCVSRYRSFQPHQVVVINHTVQLTFTFGPGRLLIRSYVSFFSGLWLIFFPHVIFWCRQEFYDFSALWSWDLESSRQRTSSQRWLTGH